MANGKSNGFGHTIITDNGSGTENTVNKTYTVKGNGFVIVFASMYCTADSYGWYRAAIYHNENRVMGSGNRWDSANTGKFGKATACPIMVSDGDTIRIWLYNSKSGTKYHRRRFLCFGCLVEV